MNGFLANLLANKIYAKIFEEFASRYESGLRANDVLGSFQNRAAANLGKKLGSAAGIKSGKKFDTFIALPPRKAVAAKVLALAAAGIVAQEVEERDDKSIVLIAAIPDNWAQFGGNWTSIINASPCGSDVEIYIEYPGQMFAWWDQQRQFKKVSSYLDDAVGRINNLGKS